MGDAMSGSYIVKLGGISSSVVLHEVARNG